MICNCLSTNILICRQRVCYLNISQNTTVLRLFIGSGRNMLMKLIGTCLQYHQLVLTRQFISPLFFTFRFLSYSVSQWPFFFRLVVYVYFVGGYGLLYFVVKLVHALCLPLFAANLCYPFLACPPNPPPPLRSSG